MSVHPLPNAARALAGTGFPEGAPCWIDVAAPDPAGAARFYGQLFGWAFDACEGRDAAGWRIARLRGLAVAGIGALPRFVPPPAWNLYVCAADADVAARRVEQAGGKVLAGPFEVSAAGREVVCVDAVGAVFRAWEAWTHVGVGLADAPGAWAGSQLCTREPERAASFYADVFGWEATAERIASPAAGAADLRSQWGVTFAVDDVDATVRAVAELGGMTVAPPSDSGTGVRAATLADPFGAAFSVRACRTAG